MKPNYTTSKRYSFETENFSFGEAFGMGGQERAEQPTFIDTDWEKVKFSQKWDISGPFGGKLADGGSGKFPWRGENELKYAYKKVFI
jgi:hypothetical protein